MLEGIKSAPIRTYVLTRFLPVSRDSFLPCKSLGPLMSSPIPLALESIRGRSTLRHVDIVKTMDFRLEPSDEVSMYVLTFLLPNLAIHTYQ
jgi:hypothetical protein